MESILKFAYLGIQLVKNIFEVVSLNRFLRIKQFEELLDELGSNINLQGFHIHRLVDHKLQEKFINALDMRPGGVDFVFLLDTCF